MRRTLFAAPLVGAIALATFAALRAGPSAGAASGLAHAGPKSPAAVLPLSHVVLFSSGVGYFQREGEVDGAARVDLTFPATDVNDLIKSLVLQDTGGGKVATINYDSPDPIERTLKTFALDLTANPSLGDLLNQARGEKVEVTLLQSAGGQGGPLTGSILGMESQRQPQGKEQTVEVDILNLVCAEGLRSVKLGDVLRVRFLNPSLDSELHRALEIIAGGRDHQKKSVSLAFKGDGKRAVKVGYVVESPMWKTTYRLVLGAGGKAMMQGWALVENTTDDDWNNVKMSLVSGRPISFQIDLYQPLYVPRPTVEPERFASLRPPTYGGAMTNPGQPVGFNGALGALGVLGPLGALGAGGAGGAGIGGGGFGGMNTDDIALQMRQQQLMIQNGLINRYQLGGQFGSQGGAGANSNNQNTDVGNNAGGRLSFEQLQQRKAELQTNRDRAKNIGKAIGMLDPSQSVASVASAEDIGDVCHYVIDEAVTLPRQKSAMLPIVSQPADAAKVSIFNESVHAKFPLLGLKFKNTAAQPLMQGPVTVYEEAGYAGDSRVQDLQPGEERLLSYAIDTGMEVKVETPWHAEQLTAVKSVLGVLHATQRSRKSKIYLIKNRSSQERSLIIEHSYADGWDLVTPEKPAEKARDVYRFQMKVPAGKAVRYEVVEENRRLEFVHLKGASDATIETYFNSRVAGPKLKEALGQARALRRRLADTDRDLAQAQAQLKEIADDQTRMRANFERMPPTSVAYKRYLEKFDQQETEIERLQAEIKAKQATAKAQTKEYEDFVAGLSVDG
jgi:hypothetical protein